MAIPSLVTCLSYLCFFLGEPSSRQQSSSLRYVGPAIPQTLGMLSPPPPIVPRRPPPQFSYNSADMATPDYPAMLILPHGSPIGQRSPPLHRYDVALPAGNGTFYHMRYVNLPSSPELMGFRTQHLEPQVNPQFLMPPTSTATTRRSSTASGGSGSSGSSGSRLSDMSILRSPASRDIGNPNTVMGGEDEVSVFAILPLLVTSRLTNRRR